MDLLLWKSSGYDGNVIELAGTRMGRGRLRGNGLPSGRYSRRMINCKKIVSAEFLTDFFVALRSDGYFPSRLALPRLVVQSQRRTSTVDPPRFLCFCARPR